MMRIIVWCATSVVWLACFEGVLRLKDVQDTVFGGHHVCGPWGCGPPTPVLLACHGFWLVLMGPPAAIALLNVPRLWVRRVGVGLVVAGACGFIAVAIWEASTWYPQASVWHRRYFGHRVLFAVITLVDAPTNQIHVG